jgi:hypothetical protein
MLLSHQPSANPKVSRLIIPIAPKTPDIGAQRMRMLGAKSLFLMKEQSEININQTCSEIKII